LWGIDVVGNVLFGRGGMEATLRNGLLQNPNTASSVVFSDVVNTSDVLNALRKNASTLCRGTSWDTSSSTITLNQAYTNNKTVICIGSVAADGLSYVDGSSPVIIDLSDTVTYDGKEIIVRGRNVILRNGSVPSVTNALNLFVDNGNILVQNDTFDNLVVNHANGYADTYFMPFDTKGNMIGDA
jgi:hypothetical protein